MNGQCRKPAAARRACAAIRFAWTERAVLIRTAKYLGTCRKAVPWYLKALAVAALAMKCMPLDFGLDETLFAVIGLLLYRRQRMLLRACWHAAQMDIGGTR